MKIIRYPLAAIFAALLTVIGTMSAVAEETVESAQVQQEVSKVSLNSATAEEISEALVGVGPARAELIVQYREQHGAFTSAEQLLEIKGIGVATLEKNKDRIEL
jgi:competence protein ComEA